MKQCMYCLGTPCTGTHMRCDYREYEAGQYELRRAAMDYGVGTFTPSWRRKSIASEMAEAAKKTNDALRIADMSFADYVAELHAGLDPAGRGL